VLRQNCIQRRLVHALFSSCRLRYKETEIRFQCLNQMVFNDDSKGTKINNNNCLNLDMPTQFLYKRIQLSMLLLVEVLPIWVVRFTKSRIRTTNNFGSNASCILFNSCVFVEARFTAFSAADSRSLKAPPMSCGSRTHYNATFLIRFQHSLGKGRKIAIYRLPNTNHSREIMSSKT
jgi:hypothetical protein